MPDDVLGSSVEISVDQSALDILSQRAEEASSLSQQAQDEAAQGNADADPISPLAAASLPSSTQKLRSQIVTENLRQRQEAQTQGVAEREALKTAKTRILTEQVERRANRAESAFTREDRIAAVSLFAEQVSSQEEFRKGLPAFMVEMGVATPSETERVATQGLIGDLPLRAEEELSPFQLAKSKAADIDERLRTEFVQEGNYAGIGNSPEWSRRRNRAYEEEGLGRRESFLGGIDAAWAIGYGSMATFTGVQKALTPLVSGDVYLPGQVAEQTETSFLPLLGSIAGTAIGMRAGPMGGFAGQFIGQSAGQSAQTLIDQWTGGHIYEQERAGQALGYGRGGAEAVQEFTDALRNAATPAAKELATTLQMVGRTGPAAPSAAGEFGQFQFQLGTAFAPAEAGVQRFLDSSPFFAGLRQTFGAHPYTGLSSTDYYGTAAAAAMSGNYDAMTQSLAFAQAGQTRSAENPAWRRDADTMARWKTMPFLQQLFDVPAQWETDIAEERMRHEPRFLPGAIPPDAAAQAAAIEAQYEQHQQTMAAVSASAAAAGAQQAGMRLALARGGGASVIGQALPGLASGVSGAISGLETDIATLSADWFKYPLQRPFYHAQAEEDRQRIAELGLVPAEAERARAEMSLQEHEAAFGLTTLRAELGGRSAAQILPLITQQAGFLQSAARAPLSPAQQSQIQASAAQMVYQGRMDVYAQNLAQNDVTMSAAGVSVARAQAYGGPEEVFSAQQQEVSALAARFRELSDELRRGGLFVSDRLRIEQERNQVEREGVQIAAASVQARASSEYGLLATGRETAAVGLSRTLALGGSAAFPQGLLASDAANVAGAQAFLAAAVTPEQRAQRQLILAQAGLTQAEDITQQATWRPGAAEQAGLSTARTNFEIARLAPFMGGPNANPLTAGLGVIAGLQRELGEVQTWDRAHPDDLAHPQNVQTENQLRLQIAQMQHERYTAMFSALPEMMVNAPGRGVGAALIPPAALSALYTPGPNMGSWGGASGPMTAYGAAMYAPGGAREGGPAGEFSKAMLNELQLIRRALEHGAMPRTTIQEGATNAVNRENSFGLNRYGGR